MTGLSFKKIRCLEWNDKTSTSSWRACRAVNMIYLPWKSLATIFYRLVYEFHHFYEEEVIISYKEPTFLNWWLTSREYIYIYVWLCMHDANPLIQPFDIHAKKIAIQMVPWHSLQILYPLENDNKQNLGGGFKQLNFFHPYLGKISNLTNIFQMGWKHQLETYPLKIDGRKMDSLDRFFKVNLFSGDMWATTKQPSLTFHFTSWLTGILISWYLWNNPHITA